MEWEAAEADVKNLSKYVIVPMTRCYHLKCIFTFWPYTTITATYFTFDLSGTMCIMYRTRMMFGVRILFSSLSVEKRMKEKKIERVRNTPSMSIYHLTGLKVCILFQYWHSSQVFQRSNTHTHSHKHTFTFSYRYGRTRMFHTVDKCMFIVQNVYIYFIRTHFVNSCLRAVYCTREFE